jgi:hypothetical protein
VDKVAVGPDFSEYFGFLCQFSFHRLLHNHHHHLTSVAGTIGQTEADVPSGFSFTPPQETKKKKKDCVQEIKFYPFLCHDIIDTIPLTVETCRDRAVNIATGYGFVFESRLGQEFSLLHVVQTVSGIYLASYPIGIGGSFPGKERSEREADHLPPTSAEVKKIWFYTSIPPYVFMA